MTRRTVELKEKIFHLYERNGVEVRKTPSSGMTGIIVPLNHTTVSLPCSKPRLGGGKPETRRRFVCHTGIRSVLKGPEVTETHILLLDKTTLLLCSITRAFRTINPLGGVFLRRRQTQTKGRAG